MKNFYTIFWIEKGDILLQRMILNWVDVGIITFNWKIDPNYVRSKQLSKIFSFKLRVILIEPVDYHWC